MLTRLRQVAFKAEGTEGTAETLTAAEADLDNAMAGKMMKTGVCVLLLFVVMMMRW